VTRFFYLKPIKRPEDVRAYLADPDLHWREGYSAFELATSWIGAGGIPPRVASVLATTDAYRDAEVVEGLFERQVDLRTPGRASQTDLLAFLRVADGYAVAAVEGKVAESFGPLVRDWNVSSGKQRRLESLCELLGINPTDAGPLRYQLFHRTASAVFEAQRYGAERALMLVHSFSRDAASLKDFIVFANALGLDGAEADTVTSAREVGGVELQLAWVSDEPAGAASRTLM
jgi:hypothetical protein